MTPAQDRSIDGGRDAAADLPPEARVLQCDERLSSLAVGVAALQSELSQLHHESEKVVQLLTDREAELAEKASQLVTLEEARGRAEEQADRLLAALAERDGLLGDHRERVTALEQELDSLRATPTQLVNAGNPARPDYEPDRHVRFVPGPSGYRLAMSDEPPPTAGDVIEIGERRFRVVKIAPSPMPGDTRACAFLLPDPGSPSS